METDDARKLERWLRSWSRVRCVKAGRHLLDVARALGHDDAVRLLDTHEHVNELVCATFASDVTRIMEVLALGDGICPPGPTRPPILNGTGDDYQP